MIGIALSSNLMTPMVSAEAYIPKDDSEVLEHLPLALSDRTRLKSLKDRVESKQNDLRSALELARSYISTGRNLSDPRYYSYAEAVLAPWVQNDEAEPQTLILMATILQNRHDFQAALAKLKTALESNPRQLQAWLTKAAIHEAQGDYSAALRSCLTLAHFSTSLPAAVCLNSALSLSGQAQYAYDQLSSAVTQSKTQPEEMAWAYTVLGEMAERLDNDKAAEAWYRKAQATGFRSNYLIMTYADFLLRKKLFDAAYQLLKQETASDALLLRLTLAEQELQLGGYHAHVEMIKERIAAARARGNNLHQSDEARFYLQVLGDAETALGLAEANWSVQNEPRDARLLLESAIAANKPHAAQPVLEFLEKTRLEDSRLRPLTATLKGMRLCKCY